MNSGRITLAASASSHVRKLLGSHPFVDSVAEGDGVLEFQDHGKLRRVLVGDASPDCAGLPELMDNNPMVCADAVSVPDAGTTLALIALGPLLDAGILLESPVLLTNAGPNPAFLERMGWFDGAVVEPIDGDLSSALTLTAICKVQQLGDPRQYDELFHERYSRCFFVREDSTSLWDVALVIGKPYAIYRLRLTPGDREDLLTVQVLADREGKCGAAQVVHAMNVMAGFEEYLGLEVVGV